MCNISRQIKLFMCVHFEKSPLIDYSNDPRFHTLYMYKNQVYKYVLQGNFVVSVNEIFKFKNHHLKRVKVTCKENFFRENILKEQFPRYLPKYFALYLKMLFIHIHNPRSYIPLTRWTYLSTY